MSNIKNGGLDQYGAEPFEQQQLGTAGTEGVKKQVDNPKTDLRRTKVCDKKTRSFSERRIVYIVTSLHAEMIDVPTNLHVSEVGTRRPLPFL